MKITIAHDLLLFSLKEPGSDRCVMLPPGRYKVAATTGFGKERWWKVVGQDFGNAIECWKAVQRPADTLRQRLEQFARKTVLLAAFCIFAFSFIKTDWARVPQKPELPVPANRLSALAMEYTRGSVFSVQEQANGEYLVSRYAAGWQLLHETFFSGGKPSPIRLPHIVQVHKELLLLLMLVTLLLPSEQLMVCALKFMLPVLLIGVLKTPAADPVMDPSLTFYYLTLAAAVAALFWNNYTDGDHEASF